MAMVNIHIENHVALVQLNRPKAHAINMDLAAELTETFVRLAESRQVVAAILTGQGNIFSGGLDLIDLYGYDERMMERFWRVFHTMLQTLAAFPKPLAAAINGHAPAGGCVLAMLADYRVMADGNFKIGLNEIPAGIVVPKPVVDLARFHVGDRKAAYMFLNGHFFAPAEARAFGLIDDHCPQAEVVLWAEARLRKWLEWHIDAWRGTKKLLRQPLVEILTVDLVAGYGDTMREWWSVDGRSAIGRSVAALTKK
ncbi:MAG: enoyl-CoA hydratase/isomerase family protein [Candidatus Hydrogenedentota bacterium]